MKKFFSNTVLFSATAIEKGAAKRKRIIKDNNKYCSDFDWKYKKSYSCLSNIVKMLQTIDHFNEMPSINNDDELDAYIAWKLGDDWVNKKSNEVQILGNNDTGSFLLPYNK